MRKTSSSSSWIRPSSSFPAALPSTIIVGAGSIGISTAYYLAKNYAAKNNDIANTVPKITLVDRFPAPMSLTSAQSGENYRNWWPHPAMVALTNHSIDLMEEIATSSNNRINMNRRGYVLATRKSDTDGLIRSLREGLEGTPAQEPQIRFHTGPTPTKSYGSFESSSWEGMPSGVDVIQDNPELIQNLFPSFDPEIRSVLHIRRGGDISGQQLGMFMLEYLREVGALHRVTGEVHNVEKNGDQFEVEVVDAQDGTQQHLQADRFVNAAGPFAGQIGRMLGVDLPIQNIAQQKIAIEDHLGAIPRTQPFSIDLDDQLIDWEDDERDLLLQDPNYAWLAQAMPGSIHCRPDGGDGGKWVKLGWAYNSTPKKEEASVPSPLDDNFPDIVLRGASRLNPALKAYYGRLPRNMHHYGGWYTATEENWPLIGPMMGPSNTEGAFMNCAMSGFGTMAACAAGSLCADWILGDGDISASTSPLAQYARDFSLARYQDKHLMAKLRASDKGVL